MGHPTSPTVPTLVVSRDVTSSQRREIALVISAPSGTYALTIDVRSRDGIRGISMNGEAAPVDTTAVHEAPDAVLVTTVVRLPG